MSRERDGQREYYFPSGRRAELTEAESDALGLLFDARSLQPYDRAGDMVAVFLGDSILHLWRQFATLHARGETVPD